MSILITSFTVELFGRTLETFYMFWISTLWISIFCCMGLFRIIFLLVGWHLMLIVFTWIPLVWSWLERVFLLALAWWEVSLLISHQIDLGHLKFTCNLLMWHTVAFDDSIFFASCLTLFAGNFSKSVLLLFMVLDTNSSFCKRNQNISLCKILAVSGGYLARDTCACTP